MNSYLSPRDKYIVMMKTLTIALRWPNADDMFSYPIYIPSVWYLLSVKSVKKQFYFFCSLKFLKGLNININRMTRTNTAPFASFVAFHVLRDIFRYAQFAVGCSMMRKQGFNPGAEPNIITINKTVYEYSEYNTFVV